jgi:hypothetical protein
MQDQPNGDATRDDVVYILTPPQARAAAEALLRDLAKLLRDAADNVQELYEDPECLDHYPQAVDTRPMFDWIAEAVETIDALGWRDVVGRAEKQVS